jgi:hypothetical protein
VPFLAMSALGQKQKFAAQKAMSALPPKADVCGATRFGPKGDICKRMLQRSEGASQRRKQAVFREYITSQRARTARNGVGILSFGDYVGHRLRAHRFSLIRRGQAHELWLKLLVAVPKSA